MTTGPLLPFMPAPRFDPCKLPGMIVTPFATVVADVDVTVAISVDGTSGVGILGRFFSGPPVNSIPFRLDLDSVSLNWVHHKMNLIARNAFDKYLV